MGMNDGATATMPSGEQDTTVTTFMLDILEAVDRVRDTAETETSADDSSPSTGEFEVSRSTCMTGRCKILQGGLTGFILNAGQSSVAA